MHLIDTIDKVIDGKISADGCPNELSKCQANVDIKEQCNPFPGVGSAGSWFKNLSSCTVASQEPRVAASYEQKCQEDGQVVCCQVILGSLKNTHYNYTSIKS